jgi:spermidine synthase|tara:strand:- start:1833 stop:2669 length:837 start_codon:yes stop_codon:yes gene_type:complete
MTILQRIRQLGEWLGLRPRGEQEREVERLRDDFGLIRVTELGELRYLFFGEQTEQSCGLIGNPAWLEYDYTRAMLLAGYWLEDTQRVLALGLGGGSLVSAVLTHLQPQQITAVELRPGVVDVARRWFGLPDDPRLTVLIDSAEKVIEREQASADLVLLDLYMEGGITALQLRMDFLEQCHAALRPGGLMVVNQWQLGHTGQPYAAERLQKLFGDRYLQVEVEEGNIVLFIPQAGELPLDQDTMRRWADSLEPQLGYSLRPYVEVLRRAEDAIPAADCR